MRLLSLVLLLVVAGPAAADELRVGAMHLPWLQDCKGKTESRVISVDCPGGERVMITPLLAQAGLSREDAHAKYTQLAEDMSARVMVASAERQGKVVRSLTRVTSARNAMIHSIASERSRMGKTYYMLQYAVSGHGGIIFFTIEGYGNGGDQAKRFDPMFAEARFE